MKKTLRNKHKSYSEVLSGLYSEAELAKMPKKVLTDIADRMYLAGKIDIIFFFFFFFFFFFSAYCCQVFIAKPNLQKCPRKCLRI